jgi:hypothetical protein
MPDRIDTKRLRELGDACVGAWDGRSWAAYLHELACASTALLDAYDDREDWRRAAGIHAANADAAERERDEAYKGEGEAAAEAILLRVKLKRLQDGVESIIAPWHDQDLLPLWVQGLRDLLQGEPGDE